MAIIGSQLGGKLLYMDWNTEDFWDRSDLGAVAETEILWLLATFGEGSKEDSSTYLDGPFSGWRLSESVWRLIEPLCSRNAKE